MGYSHYIYRPKTMNQARFELVVRDVQIVASALVDDYGLKIAGPMGTGKPIFKPSQIAFNGSENCRHTQNSEIVIPWPARGAVGIVQENEDPICGEWAAGATLATRACNGDCSYESFIINRILKPEKWQEPDEQGRFFDSCKTAFRPYDWLATAALLIIKYHFGQEVEVFTDGEDAHWLDAKLVCFSHLGYGAEFVVGEGELFPAYSNIADGIWDADTAQRKAREQPLNALQLGLFDKELPQDHPLRRSGTSIIGTGGKGQPQPRPQHPEEAPPDGVPNEDASETKEDASETKEDGESAEE